MTAGEYKLDRWISASDDSVTFEHNSLGHGLSYHVAECYCTKDRGSSVSEEIRGYSWTVKWREWEKTILLDGM